MYGIFTYIYHKNQPNVGVYNIHGSYGVLFNGDRSRKILGDQELGPLHLAAKLGDSEALRFLSMTDSHGTSQLNYQ